MPEHAARGRGGRESLKNRKVDMEAVIHSLPCKSLPLIKTFMAECGMAI